MAQQLHAEKISHSGISLILTAVERNIASVGEEPQTNSCGHKNLCALVCLSVFKM